MELQDVVDVVLFVVVNSRPQISLLPDQLLDHLAIVVRAPDHTPTAEAADLAAPDECKERHEEVHQREGAAECEQQGVKEIEGEAHRVFVVEEAQKALKGFVENLAHPSVHQAVEEVREDWLRRGETLHHGHLEFVLAFHEEGGVKQIPELSKDVPDCLFQRKRISTLPLKRYSNRSVII